MIGETLSGRYRITRELGRGGMAIVYLAQDLELEREVAVKVLPPNLMHDLEFIERFQREARVAAKLQHPNIVQIFDIHRDESLCYFVMNYLSGGSIGDWLKGQKAPGIEEVVRWGQDVCTALAYAHSRGIIHRDLKPDNIMLDGEGHAIVTDFGIARAAAGTILTRTGVTLGTPHYMSPEQGQGKKVDERSDLYSLGVVLYYLATGRVPFQAEDTAAIIYQQVHEPPPPPRAVNPRVPLWLNNAILKALAKDPGMRFQSAEAMRQSLERREVVDKPGKTQIFVPPPGPPPGEPGAEGKATGLKWAIGVLGVALVGVVIWGVLAWQEGQRQAELARQVAEQQRVEAARQAEEQKRVEAQRQEEAQRIEEQRQKDDLTYNKAREVNTKSAYEYYLRIWPKGRHITEAKAQIEEIQKQQIEKVHQEEELGSPKSLILPTIVTFIKPQYIGLGASLKDVPVYKMTRPPFKYQFFVRPPGFNQSTAFQLRKLLEVPNEITDDDSWFRENSLSLPIWFREDPSRFPLVKSLGEQIPLQIQWLDSILYMKNTISHEKYTILTYGDDSSKWRGHFISVLDKANNILGMFDFSEYRDPPGLIRGDYGLRDELVGWADINGEVLYISHRGEGYASEHKGYNAYITAIGLKSGEVFWRSTPLVANAVNFIIHGNHIITGYGFTGESDYLYILDKNTGKVEKRIPLRTGPDYIIESSGKLFVRTYDTNYLFEYH